ncbi:MAG: adenosylcobinamide-GDP ribazoletransferase [Lachnospiraceae bacterium]|nr:adenosylcobinamide-GDP ribazoletransferase [Lachnospiraceae bacterium]
MFKSLVAAFSTYSKIPMPHMEWDEKNIKYSMCFFPLVGVVIGFSSLLSYYVLAPFCPSNVLPSVVLTVLPLVITGGIHMDGFLDTIDAKSSYRSTEERMRILKDPNTGAFAVIYGMIYMLLSFGLFSEIRALQIVFVAMGYVYSRILSGLSVVVLRKAKKDGMLAKTADASDKKVKGILLIELILCLAAWLIIGAAQAGGLGIVYAAACVVAGLLTFFYYRYMAYKWFGGITGDLAGYFLQVCELMILLVIVAVKFLIMLS